MSETNSHARVEVDAAAGTLSRDASRYALDRRISYVAPACELPQFELNDGQTDIRRWPAYASDSRLVGAIDRLFVETASGKVRYASLALAFHAENDNRPTASGSVLVPIGLVRRAGDRRMVIVTGLTSEQLAGAPRLHRRPVVRADEDATLASYGLEASHGLPRGSFYDAPCFDGAPA
jgi:hypothetical protein